MTASRSQYACETQRRMGHTISDLAAIRWAEGIDTQSVLHMLREQEEAARRAGFPIIARLCLDMVDCLSEAVLGEETRLAIVATSLLESCRAIQMHGEAVGNSLRHLLKGNGFCLHEQGINNTCIQSATASE